MYTPLDNLDDWKAEALKTLRRTIDRRSFLRGGIEALAGTAMIGTLGRLFSGTRVLAAPTGPAESTSTFFFPRLKFDVIKARPIWDIYPMGDAKLRGMVQKSSNINMSQEPVVVSLADMKSLVRYPFVFATDQEHFKFSEREEANLKEFLMRGGFVYGDDCVKGEHGDLFFKDFRTMMDKMYPDNPMRRVPENHELYHCFYDFPNGLPHLQGTNHGAWATFHKATGRLLTLLTPTDLHCGWVCRWFDEKRNMAALKMGVNIIVYYLSH